MLRCLSRTTVSPIGCAVTTTAVKLAQVKWSRYGDAEVSVAERRVPNDAAPSTAIWRQAVTRALRQMLSGKSFVGRDVITCLPWHQVQSRNLRLAMMPDDELASAVHWRAAKELGYEANEFRSGYYSVGDVMVSNKRRREVIAIAAPMSDLEAHIQILTDAGLSPRAIDTHVGGIGRCLDPEPVGETGEANREPFIVIDVGEEDSVMMVVKNGVPQFIRSVGAGWHQLVERTAIRMGYDTQEHHLIHNVVNASPDAVHEDADVDSIRAALNRVSALYASELAHQISLCVHYLNEGRLTRHHIRYGCLVGGRSQTPVILDKLNDALRVGFRSSTEMLAPHINTMTVSLAHTTSIDTWLVPIGLALYDHEHAIDGARS